MKDPPKCLVWQAAFLLMLAHYYRFTGEKTPVKNTLDSVDQVENTNNQRNRIEKEIERDSEISEGIEMEIPEAACMTTGADDNFFQMGALLLQAAVIHKFFAKEI